jgi:hypothetical protein
MNPLSQFLTSATAGIAVILILSLFVKRERARFLLSGLGMALAIGLTLPIYGVTLHKWRYGLWLLPVLGGILAGAGSLVGQLIAMAWAKRAERKT